MYYRFLISFTIVYLKFYLFFNWFSADLLGGVFGLFLNAKTRRIIGIVIIIAWTFRKFLIFSAVEVYESSINPGNPLPNVRDIKLANTAKDIMPGIDEGLNQLLAKIDGEFKTKMFPMAAKADPLRHQNILPTYRNVLIHTPVTTKIAPIVQPIRIPNLSSIQLTGNAKIGCKIGKNKVFKVTNIWSY